MPFAFRVARAQRDGIRASLDAALDAGVPLSAIQHLVVIISSGVPQRRIVDARSVGTEQFTCVGAELLVHLAPPWDIHGKAELEHQQCVGGRLHPRWSPPPPMPALAAPAGKHLADSDQPPRPRRRRGRARKGRVREGVEVGISTTLQIALDSAACHGIPRTSSHQRPIPNQLLRHSLPHLHDLLLSDAARFYDADALAQSPWP